MSRIGNNPIEIPQGVTLEVSGSCVKAKGALGELQLNVRPEVKLELSGNQLQVGRVNESNMAKSLHGLTRSLISNMVLGVSKGFSKNLELVGVGYRAQESGGKLILNVGFSHPVEISAPSGINFAVSDNTKIAVSGIDKSKVGEVAAGIRKVRPPEPYKGKGIRYSGEYVKRKAGKAGKVGVGAK